VVGKENNPINNMLVSQENKPQITQDSALEGNSILNNLINHQANTRQKGTSTKYSSVFSVQGKHGANIDSKRYQIIAVDTITQNTYAIISPNRGEELSGINDLLHLDR
jgi:hypothetical protein